MKEELTTPESEGNKSVEKIPLLPEIDSPADLRRLTTDQLPQVCDELREFIIQSCSCNPGHFGSSMGAVELIVALHYVFNTPDDRIVWDVGHQAYAHKILTGRRDAFATQRTLGGLSGFPSPLESEYDTFMAGHAGNSISAALGMAIADRITPGHENRKTVAVIGDASISNGIAFEGLNNVSNNPNNLLIILNDNDMSIDDNVGALHHYLSDLTTSKGYNKWRHKTYQFLVKKGIISEAKKGKYIRFNNSLKSFISGGQNIFEGLNIRYFGPFDGHDVKKIVRVLDEIKDMEGPRILHLRTTKGKGFPEAEKDPASWHAPGKFDPQTGTKVRKNSENEPLPWQEVFGRTLVELAEKDDRVVGITAAMPSGTSMSNLLNVMPARAFDVGISEGHAVTFAGGLAAGGKRPFVAVYSSFLQRAYDNIIHDVAIQGLPVTFCIDRAGLVGEDGVTHHGLFDLAYLRLIPGLKIAAPADEKTLRNLMHHSLEQDGPLAIRYPRGKATTPDWKTLFGEIEEGKGVLFNGDGKAKIAVLTLGPIRQEALSAVDLWRARGEQADLYDMIWLKPLDTALLRQIAETHPYIVTVEDGTISGGFGSAVTEALREMGMTNKVKVLGAPDRWIHQGTVDQLRQQCGFGPLDIFHALKDISDTNLK